MNLKPLGHHIIVETVPKETTTASGIILPDAGEKPERGLVVAVGPGRLRDDGTRVALEVKIGDNVLFKKYAPDEIEGKEGEVKKKYLVLSVDDVMAIIE